MEWSVEENGRRRVGGGRCTDKEFCETRWVIGTYSVMGAFTT